jgi:hypothetical protein
MSIISRYEVRLKCIELATTMSSNQDPLDDIFTKADKIYEWINNVETGNKKPHRTGGKKPRYYSNHRRQDNDAPVKDYYAAQDDLFD